MGWGWYHVPFNLNHRVDTLFSMVESQEAEGDQDDFVIAFDDSDSDILKTNVMENNHG